MLVSCKQASAIKIEQHFFTLFPDFFLPLPVLQLCTVTAFLYMDSTTKSPCLYICFSRLTELVFVRISDKRNLQNVFLTLHYLFPKSLVNLIYLHHLSNTTTEADIGGDGQKYCSYHTTLLMFLHQL